MNRVPRWLRLILLALAALVSLLALLAALAGYFLYTPDPVLPPQSGVHGQGHIDMGGVKRRYRSYVPKGLPQGAPLVVVMHGSGEGPQRIRIGTGYGFERLADAHGFAVVYPKSFGDSWNDCSSIGDVQVDGVSGDDAAFLAALVDRLVGELGIDPARVFATGVSSGGSMAMRLALEQPARWRAVAAVVANVPAPQNFQCRPVRPGTSVMIMNGTQDPLVPYQGGEINLLGLFYKGGQVLPSGASARYFVDWNRLAGVPRVSRVAVDGGFSVERQRWHDGGRAEVELVTIHGGGHGLPQPHWRRPRLLGPSPMAPDGPALIWDFFDRQTR